MTYAEKLSYQSTSFRNRLAKRYKHLRKWARRENIFCYRLYDRDIPEVPVAVDLFEFENTERYAILFVYEKKTAVTENDSYNKNCDINIDANNVANNVANIDEWISLMLEKTAEVLSIEKNHVIVKTRRHAKGGSQYALSADAATAVEKKICGTILEDGEKFFVDLSSYIDAGIFFDHRPLRKIVRQMSSGKSVLNLFCYTGSFSVYAASGGASYIESVDLSNTYLSWAEKNMRLNNFADAKKFVYTKADVKEFFAEKFHATSNKPSAVSAARHATAHKKYDIIILDPPTFSNSKMTKNLLDINRDWQNLVAESLQLLCAKGTLFFSTNSKRLRFSEKLLRETVLQQTRTAAEKINFSVEDITEKTIPEDFRGTKPHKVWKIKII